MTQPPDKKWLPYLARADELEQRLPLVAYYCRLFVVEAILALREIPGYDNTLDNILFKQLEICEAAKPSLKSQLDDGQGRIEEFTIGIFANCDRADRESPTQPPDVTLAGKFYVSSLFFDVLTQFYPDKVLPPDLEEKRRYAKYRTIQIRNRKPIDKQPENSHAEAPNPPARMPSSSSPATNTKNVQGPSSTTGFKYAESGSDESPVRPSPPASAKPVRRPVAAIPVPVPREEPQPDSPVTKTTGTVSRTDASNAKKKLQQAISAIDFGDYATAGKLCNESCTLLGFSK